jgi:hypothetical protein
MTGETSGISAEKWAVFRQWGCRGTDFDWFALDRQGHLGVFTTARQGPVPMTFWEHFEQFQQLRKWVDELPSVAPSVQVFPGEGNYRDWAEYALKGLFAFDFQDELRGGKANGYDLIAYPLAPLRSGDAAVGERAAWLPVLDVDFPLCPVVPAALLLPYGMHQ